MKNIFHQLNKFYSQRHNTRPTPARMATSPPPATQAPTMTKLS